MSRETEAKFTVSDLVSFNQVKAMRELAGFTLSGGEEVAVTDVYQDTPGRALLAAGWALRWRQGGGRVLVTAKRLAPSLGPIHEREELELPLESIVIPPQWPDGELRSTVLALMGEEPLVTLFEVRQQRFVRDLALGGRNAAEMSLDQVRVLAGGREREYLELEIELSSDGTREELFSMLAALGRDLSLVPSARSKFEEGLLLLDGEARLTRGRRSARQKAAPPDWVLQLEAPHGTAEEAVHAALSRLGYRFRARSRRQENRAYFDTQGGSLFKQGIELYFSQEDTQWHFVRRGREEHAQKGRKDGLPEKGPVADSLNAAAFSFPRVPCLEATLRETVLSIASMSAPRLGLAIRAWQLSSPLHDVPAQTALTLALDRQGASSYELDYLAGLLTVALDLHEQAGPDLQFCLIRLGVPLPGAPLPRGFLPAEGDSPAVICGKVLSGEAWRMKANTPGAIRDLDPEFVHDLRVATRRARFACRLFVGVLDPEKRDTIRTELSWIAGLLGSVRDLDVLIARLSSQLLLIDADQSFQAAVTAVLAARRTRATSLLVSGLGSARYAALLELMSSQTRMPAAEADGPRADEFGRRRIGKALGKIATWTQRSHGEMSPVELHRLRILFKRLRYTAEFFRPILGENVALLVKECVVYQDCLGMFQDARVAVEVLTGLADEPALRERPEGLLALGALIQLQRDTMNAQRERFRTLWSAATRLFDIWAGRAPEARS